MQHPAETLTIPAADGYPLAATLFARQAAGGDCVLIQGAMGVPRTYYDAFAGYLGSRGLTVVTVDYRGIGGSRPARLRGFRARYRDWAELDLAGVHRWIWRELAPRRLAAVGHSAGGQLLGLTPGAERFDRVFTVAAQSGHWRFWSGWWKTRMFLLWWLVMPVLTPLLGRFPSRAFGLGEDLPAGVALQWARWGRHRDYIVDAAGRPDRAGFDRCRFPLRVVGFSDDPYAPRSAVQAFAGFFAHAAVEQVFLRPADVGLPRIGHFGFFRESSREALWREAADWLEGAEG